MAGGLDFNDTDAIKTFLIGSSRRLGTAGKVLFPIPDRKVAKRLYRITNPTLLVWGDDDRYLPRAYADAWQRAVEGADLEIIPEAGHRLRATGRRGRRDRGSRGVTGAEHPVVISGGGLVGLSTAMFLAQHGVPSIVVEQSRGLALPRAAPSICGPAFRAAGIEDEVKAQSETEFLPEGAIISMDTLAGRKLADIIPGLNVGVDDALSPCRRLFITQRGLEPILRGRARSVGAEVIEGSEVVASAQDDEGVSVTLADVESGARRTIRTQFLVAAEGAHSGVRDSLGIAFEGRGVFSNSLTIYFTADLAPQLLGKPLSVIYISNDTMGGFFRVDKDCQRGFLVVNTIGDPATNPDVADAAKDTSEPRLVELVRAAAGVSDLAVKIDGVARWRASSTSRPGTRRAACSSSVTLRT